MPLTQCIASQLPVLTSSQNPIGTLYGTLYSSPSLQNSVTNIRTVSSAYSITPHAAALRWTAHHSALNAQLGDAVVFGASSIEQLNGTLDALEAGPLPQELAEAFEGVYELLEGSGPEWYWGGMEKQLGVK